MQLKLPHCAACVYQVCCLEGIDETTVQRLQNLGLQLGSRLTPVRFYPFHGPVIIEIEHQRIGVRYDVFLTLTGGK